MKIDSFRVQDMYTKVYLLKYRHTLLNITESIFELHIKSLQIVDTYEKAYKTNVLDYLHLVQKNRALKNDVFPNGSFIAIRFICCRPVKLRRLALYLPKQCYRVLFVCEKFSKSPMSKK